MAGKKGQFEFVWTFQYLLRADVIDPCIIFTCHIIYQQYKKVILQIDKRCILRVILIMKQLDHKYN